MSRDLDDLDPTFQQQVDTLIRTCAAEGIKVRPFFTLRTPKEQAGLWRQSRASQTIEEKISFLDEKSAPYLASVLKDVAPQSGAPVTNALPGQSWHQWGEALDCFWLFDGGAEWSTRKKVPIANGLQMNGYAV